MHINTTVKAEKETKRFRLIRNCMFLSGLSVFAQLYLFQPMLSELCTSFRITPAMSSLAVSVSTIGMAAGLFVFAFKADSLSRHRLMGVALVLSSALTVLSAFAWNFPLLLVINFLKGAVLSGVSAVALAYLSEEVDASVIGLAISLYLSGNTVGGMAGRVMDLIVSCTVSFVLWMEAFPFLHEHNRRKHKTGIMFIFIFIICFFTLRAKVISFFLYTK